MKTFKTPTKLTLKVRRPNGEIEFIIHPTLKTISAAQFEQIKKGTKDAGRGEVLDYTIEYKTVSGMSKSEMMCAGSDQTVENMSRMGE